MNTEIYMIVNGVDSRDKGIYIVDPLPPVVSPQKILTSIKIPGRSQNVTVWDGSYEEIPKTPRIYFDGIGAREACCYLNDAETVTFSNEPDYQYLCRNAGSISFDRVRRQRHLFQYPLICCAEKREVSPTEINLISGMEIENPGNCKAIPSFQITGSGTIVLTVGDQEVTVTSLVSGIVLDGDLQECFSLAGTPANTKMTGEFPIIEAGETVSISWTGGHSILMLPNWRFV